MPIERDLIYVHRSLSANQRSADHVAKSRLTRATSSAMSEGSYRLSKSLSALNTSP